MTPSPAGSFEIEVPTLRAALKDVLGVVEARNTVPVLSNVLLVTSPTSLTITATDLDSWGERHVGIDKADRIAITVEAAVLGRIVDKLPQGATARLAYDAGKLTVSAGRSRFTLPTLPSDDFPILPRLQWDAEFEMPAIALAAALGAVAFAASTEETRYYLNGVFVHAPSSGDLRFVTTDGHRLGRGVIARPDGAEELPDVIIPRKVVKVLDGLLSRHEGKVDVRVAKGRIRVEIGQTVVQAKTIDGEFPDYTRIMPTSHETLVTVDREALSAAVARVITVSTDKTRAVKAEIDRDVITVSVSSPENGTAVEELPCGQSGPAITIGFNARYLLDIVGHLAGDTIELLMSDAAGPTLWRDHADSALSYVLMPLRV